MTDPVTPRRAMRVDEYLRFEAALSLDAIYRGVQLPAVGKPEAAEYET